MTVRRRALATLAVAALAFGVAAEAAGASQRAVPLADVAPAPGAELVDRIVERRPARARAAQSAAQGYRTEDGYSVSVALSSSYAADDAVARSSSTSSTRGRRGPRPARC